MRAWLVPVVLMLMAPFASGQCVADSFPNVNLGVYTGVLSTSGVTADTVVCSSGSVLNIGFNQGTAPGATVTTRSMTGPGSALLYYALYQDAARTMNWGNTIGTDTNQFTGTGASQNIYVYPSVAAGQTVPSGYYVDTISVLVTGFVSTNSATFTVSATYLPTCSVSTTALAFGNYIPTAESDATSTITVNCTNSTPYTVGVDYGQNANATARYMRIAGGGASLIGYGLFKDAAHTMPWGTAANGISNVVAGTGTGVAQSLTAYGAIPSRQFGPAGAYSDLMTVTVTY